MTRRPITMRVDHRVHLPQAARASGRLRFSVTTVRREENLRLMVVDDSGRVRHRMSIRPVGTRTPIQLTGFPRGEVFLVCAFSGDDMVWSSPVLAG